MQDFASVKIPLGAGSNPLVARPMYMVWHQRFQRDPAHSWLRAQLEHSVADAAGQRR